LHKITQKISGEEIEGEEESDGKTNDISMNFFEVHQATGKRRKRGKE